MTTPRTPADCTHARSRLAASGRRLFVWLFAAALLSSSALSPVAASDLDIGRRPLIVTFDHMPDDVTGRLGGVGVTHAAVFEAANSISVLGSDRAYSVIASWPEVREAHYEIMFQPTMYQAKVQTRVDRVHAGDGVLQSPYSGAGVTVAVVDTGMASTHPDLDDRIAVNLNFGLAHVLDPITDGEYSRKDAEVPAGTDEHPHGTAVAGVLAGTGEAAQGLDDMRGVAPGATLINASYNGPEAFGYELGFGDAVSPIHETSLLAAYQWLIDHRNDPRFPGGIRVVSNSWSGTPTVSAWTAAMTQMLDSALDKNMVLVFGAGNWGPESDSVGFPASLPWVISVGAICKPDHQNNGEFCPPMEVASFSSRGPQIDIVAPGVDVWSASLVPGAGFLFLLGQTDYPRPPGFGNPLAVVNNKTWYDWNHYGTSFATPHVSGIVALMLEANPALTHTEIEQILKMTATDLGPAGFDEDYGYGQVDALAAVRMAEDMAQG